MLSDQSAEGLNFLPAVMSLWQNTTGDGVAASSSLLARRRRQGMRGYELLKGEENSYVWCDMWAGIGIRVKIRFVLSKYILVKFVKYSHIHWCTNVLMY